MIRAELVEHGQRLLNAHEPFVYATVVRAVHPTSVRAGDSALVLADGEIVGFVGGHCAQSSVRLHAARTLETGEPILLRVAPEAATNPQEEGVVFSHNPCLSGGALDIFLDPQLPPQRLVVAGTTPIAQALSDIAWAAGYAVTTEAARDVSPRPGDAAVIVASHGEDEEIALARALEAGVPYVGLVASDRRGEAVRASLDVDDVLRARLHSPAGLRLGAATPAEIAIAILAEIVAERTSAPAVTAPVRVASPQTAVDPVCGMEVVVGDGTIQAEVGDECVYFCCDGCRSTYLERVAGDVAAS